MPQLRPFRGLRYSPRFTLSEVTAPPYDVISPKERARLLASDPHNFVHVTLGGDHPVGPVTDGRYSKAASTLRRWIAEATLVTEPQPSFYLYVMDHERGTTVGIVGALQLADGIFPHERTMPAPKQDRLELMRSTRANLEPLWFFASSPLSGFADLAERTLQTDPIASVTDPSRVAHRLWRLAPPSAEDLVRSISTTNLVIADGHHRYETALTYQRHRASLDGEGAWDATLALIVDPIVYPPALLPIHRIVDGLSVEDIGAVMEPFRDDVVALEKEVLSRGCGHVGFASAKGNFIAKSTTEVDTDWLAELVGSRSVSYEHKIQEVARLVGGGAFGFVLAPVTMQVVAERALSGSRMPPKTTLFWPKPVSGLIVRDLAL